MWKDPIVEEARSAGRKLAEQAGNNLHKLCEALRKSAEKRKRKLLRKKPLTTGGARGR